MKSEQINELATALVKAQSEIKSAHKDSNNPFFKSKYADLGSIWAACKEALNKNGLSVVQGPNIDGAGTVFLETMLLHTSGQYISSECPLINVKGEMQGLGSAISYARRYSLAAICGVVTDDDDANVADQKGDTKSPGDFKENTKIDFCTEKQAKMIHAKLKAAGLQGLEAAAILNKFGTHLPERIPFVKVNEVLAAIEETSKSKTKHKDYDEPPPQEEMPYFEPNLGWNKKH